IGIRKGGIRNESMKKLGTPIGAGPGSDSEKVGLVADGTPLPVGRLPVVELVLVVVFFLALAFLLCWPLDDGCWPLLVPVGTGVVLDVVVEVDDVPLCEG